MASPHAQPNHLASLLQGLSAGTPSPTPPSPAPSAAGQQGNVNTLLRMLSGGGGGAPAAAAPLALSPPPPASPASNRASSSFSLLDLLNQRPSGPPAAPSPTHSYGSGSRYEASPSQAARSDVSQAGSPGGRLGGTSLMEMLMQGCVPLSRWPLWGWTLGARADLRDARSSRRLACRRPRPATAFRQPSPSSSSSSTTCAGRSRRLPRRR